MKKQREEFIIFTTLRHKMHVCRWGEFNKWIDYLNQFREAATSITIKCDLPLIDDEDAWCDRDDCDEHCEFCEEKGEDLLEKYKEIVNSRIEEWMSECEEAYDLVGEIVPTGAARSRWMMSA